MAQSVTPAVLAGALTSFRTVFNGAFEAAMSGPAGGGRRTPAGGRVPAGPPAQLLFNLPISNPLAFDAVALIADTRVIGRSANIDNQIAGTGTTGAPFQ